MKLVTIIGARPQFVKAAVLSRTLPAYPDMQELIIHTGQHFDKDMSADFFDELKIPAPAYNLAINNLPAAEMTASMLEAILPLLLKEAPDMVIVYGDTNSTLAGALAAKKLQIPICHIEAGLRSGDMQMQEELNRLITDRISDLLFCPTAVAEENLLREGFERSFIRRVGDIMFDAAIMFSNESKPPKSIFEPPFAICTFHRHGLLQSKEKLLRLLHELAALNREIPVKLIAHPRTKKLINELDRALPFSISPPLSYLEMIDVLGKTDLVITDSGGLQKEAYFFKKPCITIRSNTEWTELVHAGVNILAGEDGSGLLTAYRHFTQIQPDFSEPFYGNGNTAIQIIDAIREFINARSKL